MASSISHAQTRNKLASQIPSGRSAGSSPTARASAPVRISAVASPPLIFVRTGKYAWITRRMIVIPGRGIRIAQAFVAFGNRLFQHLDHWTSWTNRENDDDDKRKFWNEKKCWSRDDEVDMLENLWVDTVRYRTNRVDKKWKRGTPNVQHRWVWGVFFWPHKDDRKFNRVTVFT